MTEENLNAPNPNAKIHTIKQLVVETAKLLSHNGLKLVTAESCTGGGLSYWLTSLSGSSAWFERGFVTYSDASKIEMIDVHVQTITRFGAVSQETACEMAEGALLASHADIGIAITGIAGPTGETKDKPVGTVCLAWSMRTANTQSETQHFEGDRISIRLASIIRALSKLNEILTHWKKN